MFVKTNRQKRKGKIQYSFQLVHSHRNRKDETIYLGSISESYLKYYGSKVEALEKKVSDRLRELLSDSDYEKCFNHFKEKLTNLVENLDEDFLQSYEDSLKKIDKNNLAKIVYYGGKQRLSEKIVPLIPPHTIYCEPFGGGAAVLLRKPPLNVKDYREVYNDKNPALVTFHRVAATYPKTFLTNSKRLECLWMNFQPLKEEDQQLTLF